MTKTTTTNLTLKWIKILSIFIALTGLSNLTYAQDTYADTLNCSGGTPTFVVDLSANSDSTWISAPVSRAGTCCTPPDNNCVQFTVTLAPDADGLEFSIPSGCGATPGGALFYQVDCGPQTPVGTPICLGGTGPFVITFCKPGANTNCFSIESFSEPSATLDITVTDGCSDVLTVSGLIENTITWTSISPGAVGDYDGLLSETANSDTSEFTPTPGAALPATIGYKVCGTPVGNCTMGSFCDTVYVTIVPELDAEITPLNPTICFGGSGVDLTVSGIGGLAPYTYLWNTGETTATITASTVGTYFVELLDSLGCGVGRDTVEVTEYLAAITANAGTDETICKLPVPSIALNGSITGSTTAEWSGGTGTYATDETDLTANYTPSAAELLAGSVTLTLTTTDNGSCPAASDDVVFSLVDFTTVLDTIYSNVDCFGNATGSIDVVVTGGALPLTYNWSNGATTEDISALVAGTYTLDMVDNNGCASTMDVLITEPTDLTISASVTNIGCHGFGNGEIDVTVSGGTGPYTYLWNTGATDEDLVGVPSGVYTVVAFDDNGCTAGTPVFVVEPAAISIASVVSDISCTGANDGSIIILPSGGTPPYTYLWDTGATTANLSGLSAGSYSLILTDANGCEETFATAITEPTVLSLTSSLTHLDCFGDTDGEIDITITGGIPPYSYVWNTGAVTEDLTGLGAGNYNVAVTDMNGCSVSFNGNLTEPTELTASASLTDIACFGGTDGEIDVTVLGGTSPYSYAWSTGAVTEDLTGIVAGTYDVIITDAKGCSVTVSSTITEPTALSAASVPTDVSCFGLTDGAIGVSVTGGTGAYTYLWNSGEVTEDLAGIDAGAYSLTITDGNGCEVITSSTITEPAALVADKAILNPTCFGESDGEFNITTTGGVAPYTYLWNTGHVTEDIVGLSAGNYDVTVTDINGCFVGVNDNLIDPAVLTGTPSLTHLSCAGLTDGAIDMTVSGGTGAYTYLWNTGEVSEDLTGLLAGTFDLSITDANGCTSSVSSTIIEPTALMATATSTDISCFGNDDGMIGVAVAGGTGAYTYLWNTGAVTEDLVGLEAGVYSLTVTDDNGCELVTSATVAEPSVLTIDGVLTNPSCFEGTDGTVDVTVAGGTGVYTYLWSTGDVAEDLTGLAAGVYDVTASDENGCTTSLSHTLVEPTELTGVFTTTDATCFGTAGGTVDITISGGTVPYTYLWGSGDVTEDAIDLFAGDYSVTASDANGCTVGLAMTIAEPEKLVTVLTGTDETCDILNDGTIDLDATGGTGAYTFVWNTGAIVEDLTALDSGMYVVAVTDAAGCTVLDSLFIDSPVDFDAGNDSTAAVCSGDGIINLNSLSTATTLGVWSETTASGAFNPFTGALDLTDLAAGVYSFEYTIASYTPCTNTTASFSITVNPQPTIGFVADEVDGCDEQTVVFTSSTDVALAECNWSFGDGAVSNECGEVSHTYTESGTFDVSLDVVSTDGCESSFEINSLISIGVKPIASFSYYPSNPNVFNPEVEFENNSEDAAYYEWNFGDYSPLSYESDPVHYFPEAGNESYAVQLKAISGDNPNCFDIVTEYILVEDIVLMYVPNAFTPNGNGYNNSFMPVVTAGVDVYDYHLTIFNRYGEVLFESFNPAEGWDGTYGGDGDLVQDGVYVWKIDFRETMSDKTHNLFGNVSLLR